MAFCNQCGTGLPEGAKFCASCGAPVAGAADIGATSAPVHPAPDAAADAFRRPPIESAPTRGSGFGWVLPVLVGLAALAIVYLLFGPKSPGTTPAERTAAEGRSDGGAEGTRTGSDASRDEAAPGSDTERSDAGSSLQGSSVGAAGDAADAAGARARAASGIVSAPTLDSAFFRDPDGAAVRYAGPVRVAGTIATMVQPGPTPALSMEGRTRFNYMIVNFPAGYREQLAPLSKGRFITVACDEVRSLGGTTILSGCLLE